MLFETKNSDQDDDQNETDGNVFLKTLNENSTCIERNIYLKN